jgi:hypothetical protein
MIRRVGANAGSVLDEAATSLVTAGPDDPPTSLGERVEEEQRTALTPMTSLDPPTTLDPPTALDPPTTLDPPTVLDRAAAGQDDQTALPFATSFAGGVRTEMGGSPFDLPSNEGVPNVIVGPEDLPTSLGSAPDSDPVTYMPSNAFNPRPHEPAAPDTVLGFRDVGPSARGTGSSARDTSCPREPDDVPSAIRPSVHADAGFVVDDRVDQADGRPGTYEISEARPRSAVRATPPSASTAARCRASTPFSP